MIKINEKAKNIIKKLHNNFYVLSDFDRTITTSDSLTTWAILANTNLVSKEYVNERNLLYNYYRPIEINNNIPFEEKKKLMNEWFEKHLNLFVKYQLQESVFKKAIVDNQVMKFKEGAKEYLKFLYDNNIPLIIVSAGIGNFIEKFLMVNNCYYDNIFINANYIYFKNKTANLVYPNIIHSLNKDEYQNNEKIKNKINEKKYVLLFGDQIEDVKMIGSNNNENVIKIGFLTNHKDLKNFEKTVDIIVDDNESYIEILKQLSLI